MKKLENIQNPKLSTSYGGSGSVIETKDNGSLIVMPYDQWKCYGTAAHITEIQDARLMRMLQQCGFTSLQHIYKIPTNDLSDRVYRAGRRDTATTVMADYFPKWFYCPHCRRLHKLDEWENLWNDKFPTDGRFSVNRPSCYHCSSENNNRISRYPLEQVRFVMASYDTAQLEDIPFDLLENMQNDQGPAWNLDNLAPTHEQLYYRTSQNGDGLESTFIQFGNGRPISLARINSKYLVRANGSYRMILRNATNLYFPSIVKSIFIPKNVDPNVRQVVLRLHDTGMTAHQIVTAIGEVYNLYLDDVETILLGNDISLDEEEFAFITNRNRYNNNVCDVDLEQKFVSVCYPNLHYDMISEIYGIRRLKETSVITDYCRISTKPKIWWDRATQRETQFNSPAHLPTSITPKNQIEFIPATESYGEGLFFVINIDGINPNDRLTFIHSLSHLIMKEMEFQCGYPLTSLKEKLYFYPDVPRVGFLIYTIAGSEGSYGGLVSLLPNDTNDSNAKIIDLLDMAKQRAKNCPNDPICRHSEGHCFACLDLPETSCTQFWNDFLDRRVLLNYFN